MYTNIFNDVMFYSPYFKIERICRITSVCDDTCQVFTFEFEIDDPTKINHQSFNAPGKNGILWLFNTSTNFGMSPDVIIKMSLMDNLHSIFCESPLMTKRSYYVTIEIPIFKDNEALKFVLEGLR